MNSLKKIYPPGDWLFKNYAVSRTPYIKYIQYFRQYVKRLEAYEKKKARNDIFYYDRFFPQMHNIEQQKNQGERIKCKQRWRGNQRKVRWKKKTY